MANTTSLVLTYDSALDPVHPPGPASFAVLVDGTANNVTGVAVAGSAVTLTLATPLSTGQAISVTYTDPTAGNDANAIQDLAGNDAVTITTGKLADGYVRYAQIYIDANGNGLPEASEMLAGVLTDVNGNFFLPNGVVGAIMAVGGVNIDTGIANTAIMKAPSGSTFISPMTTLVQAYIEANPSATTGVANTAVLTALNLPTNSGIDLTNYDPITILQSGSNADALAVQKVAAQVSTVIQLAAASPSGVSAETAANAVVANLVNQVGSAFNGSTTLNLADTATLNSTLGSTTSASASNASTANTEIASAGNLGAVSAAQSAALDTTPPAAPSLALVTASDTGISTTDGITSVTAPSLRVSFNVTATDGTAVVAGNTLSVFNGTTSAFGSPITLTAADVLNGYRDIPLTGLAPNASYSLSAKISDAVPLASAASPSFTLTIDTQAAGAPTLTLVADTGLSANDAITNNGLVNISGLETGASWQYSTDGGATWTAGTASSLTLAGDGSKSVLARQSDLAGNTSSNSGALGLTLDTGAPATPTINNVANDDFVNAIEKSAGVLVSGSAESGARVQVVWGGASHTVTASAGTWTTNFSNNEIPSDGSATVVVTVVDAAGNTSAAGTRAVSIDTAAPTAPVIHAVATDNTVNAAERAAGVVVSGSAESGASVAINWGGTTHTVNALSDGSWSSTFSSTESLASGNITVTATDAAGNAASSVRAVSVNTATPGTPAINLVAGNDIVNATEKAAGVVVSGTADANVSVAVTWGATTQAVVANGSGVWTSTFASSAVPASGNISAVASDAAGNTSAAGTRSVSVDTTAPNAPVINLVAADDTVNLAEQTAGVTVSGTAEANVALKVYWDSAVYSTTAASNGTWSVTFTSAQVPADGASAIVAIAQDAAGNASAAATRAVTINTPGRGDIIAPNAPDINVVTSNDIVSAAEKAAGVAVSGMAESGATVVATWGTAVKTVQADSAGAWIANFASGELPADGTSSISVTARDIANNPSAASTRSVSIDISAPNAPVINNVATDNTVNATEKAAGVLVSGSAEANASVEVSWGATTQTVLANGSGNWASTFASSAIPASGNITAVATDAAGNSSATGTRAVTIDTALPVAPTIGNVATDNVVNAAEKSAGVLVSGTAEAGSSVAVTWGGTTQTVTAVGGSWSTTFASNLVPASGNITAIATDSVGNASDVSTRIVSIDTAAPTAPVIHAVATDNTVNAAERAAGVVVSGSAESGASVAINWGGTTHTVNALSDGSWSSTFSSTESLASGNITVTATDAAGNAASSVRAVSVNTATPGTPAINLVAGNDIVNATEKAAGVVVSGTADANVSVAVTWGATTQAVVANGSGVWTSTFASSAVPASGNISAVASDAAGNTSAAGTRSVSVDTTAPNAPVINLVAADDTVNAAEKAAGVVVSGTAEAGASVAVTWGGTTQTVTAAGGSWSTTFASGAVAASGNITAVATDAAGNASASAARAVTVDTTAPGLPVINAVAGDDNVNVAEKTAGVVVGGTSEIGSTVAVTWGATTKSVVVGATGNWSTSFGAAEIPDSGLIPITASVTDAAGNANTGATTRAVSIDHTATNRNVSLNAGGIDAAALLTAVTGVDSITLASGQVLNLTASEYTANSVVLGKITNLVTDYVINVSEVTSSNALSLGARANIDSIALSSGQTLSLTASQYAANAGALGKISNPTANYTVKVTAVSGADALDIAAHDNVDSITLLVGQTFNLTAAQYKANSVALGKISNTSDQYSLNVSGVTSADALAIAAQSNVHHITLLPGQSFALSAAEFSTARAAFDKFTNAPSEYSVTLTLASSTDSADIASLIAGGDPKGYVDTLNLADNAVSLTDAQASSLVRAGLAFHTSDTAVEVTSDPQPAAGGRLKTSLSDLQKLGVDVVNVGMISGTAAGLVGIEAGSGAIDFAHLPAVHAAGNATVGLEVSSAAFTSLNVLGHTVDLKTAGFNTIMVTDGSLTIDSADLEAFHKGSNGNLVFDSQDTITMQVTRGNEHAVHSLASAIQDGSYTHDIDIIDMMGVPITLTDAEAATLVTAGLQFGGGDNVAVHAVGTHLQTSLHDLQALGVDVVHTDAGVNTVVVNLGSSAPLPASILPIFDTQDKVTLVANDNQLGDVLSMVKGGGFADSHIDTLAVVLHNSFGTELSGSGVFDPAFHSAGLNIELDVSYADHAVTLGMLLDAADGSADPLMSLNGAGLVSALQAAGIITHIDSITQFVVADTDLAPLLASGLLSASAAADVTVSNSDGTLDVSLAQLAAIGADHVHTTGGQLALDAGIASTSSTAITAELNQLLKAFEAAPGGTAKAVFDQADTVELKVAATFATGFHLDPTLFHDLQLLGIDDVLDATGHSIK